MNKRIVKLRKTLSLFIQIPVAIGFWIVNGFTPRHVFRKKMGLIESARVWFARAQGAKIGSKSAIRKGQFVTDFTLLTMGERSTLGPFSRLFLFERFEIGDDVEIGSGLTVHTSEHELFETDKPLGKQGSVRSPVVINSDVYIGSNVTILSGAIIESRVVVGASALVTGRLESGYLYAGVPAKKIKPLVNDN